MGVSDSTHQEHPDGHDGSCPCGNSGIHQDHMTVCNVVWESEEV